MYFFKIMNKIIHKHWRYFLSKKQMSFAVHWDFASLVEDPKIYVELFPCWSKSRERTV